MEKSYYNLDFTAMTTDGMLDVVSYAGANVTVVDDATATGGKALSINNFGTDARRGAVITFTEAIDVSKYSQILIYVRTEGDMKANFRFNGTEQEQDWSSYETYTAVDLKVGCTQYGITTLESLLISDSDRTGYVYIDKIVLVEAE